MNPDVHREDEPSVSDQGESSTTRVEADFRPGDDYRPTVARVVALASALDPPIPAHRLDDLRLVVTEACANASDAHPLDATGPIRVVCSVDPDRAVEVEVQDRGPGFDPEAVPSLPEPEDPARLDHESGLGLELIRTLADRAEIDSSERGTSVRMAIAPRDT